MNERKKNIIVGALAVILLLFVVFIYHPSNASTSEKLEIKDIRIEVAEQITVDKLPIRYHGMPNNERFALCGYHHSSPIFYPIDVNEFNFYGYKFKLKEATPMYIELTSLGKVEE